MATYAEDINEALLKDVLAIYSEAEDKMLKAVAKRVAKGIKTEGWNETKLKDTQALKSEIEKYSMMLLRSQILLFQVASLRLIKKVWTMSQVRKELIRQSLMK